ncbi:MAG: site-specific integrase [Brachybacterium sp.]|uniref:tyrosine-type recombinase/integrase n=1 Tax=Brachybacterium sp. TaxID=1891286 RepID=UPI002648D6C7|nr:site-specific integrase [Brachybacterium sp.]MDN5688752.1 site-specific integrase [Brachybacterium sp.]
MQIAHIVESDIRTWLADIQKEVSSSRARQAFILYRQILDLAVADKALVRNPAAGVKAPRAKTSRDAVFLTIDQVHEIADAMPRPADAALVRFLAFTGLRWGEAVAVTVDGIDFDRHIIHVRRTYSEDGGRVITGTPKDHAARWVPFPAGMDSDLRALVNGRSRGSDVFQTPAGGVLRSGNWTARVLRPAVEDVNAPKDGGGEREDVIPPGLRIHDLRHTAASVAIRAGANVKALQRMLGHESATMTLDVYAGLWDDDLRDLGSSVNAVAYPLRTGNDERS